jgi:membrane protease YdiL (CAAX protease family)
MYYRGILFLALSARFGDRAAITVVTVIFALMHALHRIYVLPIAIVLGVARLKTGSVASCFALHASYNLFLVLYQVVAPS